MSGFFDSDYARDKRIAELQRRVSALEQRILDLERAPPAENSAGSSTEGSSLHARDSLNTPLPHESKSPDHG